MRKIQTLSIIFVKIAMKKQVLSILPISLLILGLSLSAQSQAQESPSTSKDTTNYYRIKTQNGTVEGRIVLEDERELQVVKSDGTRVIIPTYAVQMKTVVRNPKTLGPIIHPTRYLYAPSAIPLKQGEGYLNMIYFLLVQAQYGITDNISIGMTTTPILMPTFVNLKIGTKIGEDLYASFGGQLGKLFYGDEESLGLLFANITYGNNEANITLNTGYGFYTNSGEQLPIIEVSGLYQTSPKVSLVGEIWMLLHQNSQPTFIGGPALRINALKNGFVDVGVLSAAFSVKEDNGYYDMNQQQWISNYEYTRKAYWPIPFISLGITF
jgi:hypothetical protein